MSPRTVHDGKLLGCRRTVAVVGDVPGSIAERFHELHSANELRDHGITEIYISVSTPGHIDYTQRSYHTTTITTTSSYDYRSQLPGRAEQN